MFICCFLLFAVAVAGPCTWHLAAWKTSLSFHMSSTFVWRGCALCFLCLENSSWLPAAIDFQPRWEWTEFDARSVWYMFGIKDKNIICHIYIYIYMCIVHKELIEIQNFALACIFMYIFAYLNSRISAHLYTFLHILHISAYLRTFPHVLNSQNSTHFCTLWWPAKNPPKKRCNKCMLMYICDSLLLFYSCVWIGTRGCAFIFLHLKSL